MTVDLDPAPAVSTPKPDDPRLAHLVLRDQWPIALCGALVTDCLGDRAPAMDRCLACNRIAVEHGHGRPGWVA